MPMNKRIIDVISEKIPSNIKLVDYLMERLELSRESIYRRIRGDLPFTFNQVMKLSSELKFSMDSINSLDGLDVSPSSVFRLQRVNEITPEEKYRIMLEGYNKVLNNQLKSKIVGTIVTMNMILDVFPVKFETLSRFNYYRWLDMAKDLPFNYNFSKLVVPDEIKSLQQEIKRNLNKINNTTFIVDSGTFRNALLEIQYYYDRGHINDKDLALLKSELAEMLSNSETTARKGIYDSDHQICFYISTIHIPVNSIYVWYGNNTELYIWPYIVNPLYNKNNKDVKNIHLEWIASLKKRSISISQSNQILQEKHYNNERRNLETIL